MGHLGIDVPSTRVPLHHVPMQTKLVNEFEGGGERGKQSMEQAEESRGGKTSGARKEESDGSRRSRVRDGNQRDKHESVRAISDREAIEGET